MDRVHEVKNIVEQESESSQDFDILEISGCSEGRGSEWLAPATVAGKEILFKVDTGAQANLLPLSWLLRARKNIELQKSAAVLQSYNGGVISHK